MLETIGTVVVVYIVAGFIINLAAGRKIIP